VPQKKRSTRGHLVELVVVVFAFGAIYLFLMNGGPTAFGRIYAQLLGAP
jgi:hypothetical protein